MKTIQVRKTIQRIALLPAQRQMILFAMSRFRQMLHSSEQIVFDIAYKKVFKSNGQLDLDGMEMECIAQALQLRAQVLFEMEHVIESTHYHHLHWWIRRVKRNFQQSHNPLNKKETASAGTLTVSSH